MTNLYILNKMLCNINKLLKKKINILYLKCSRNLLKTIIQLSEIRLVLAIFISMIESIKNYKFIENVIILSFNQKSLNNSENRCMN
jgi:hypothetical protein